MFRREYLCAFIKNIRTGFFSLGGVGQRCYQ
jgi:hypothetical protein